MTSSAHDARFWNRLARKYAASPIRDMTGYERTVDHTAHLLASSDTVLELGCGTGTTALRLAPRVTRIVATDFADEMIVIAREKAAEQGCANAEFAVAMPDQVAAPDAAFDAILAFNLLHLVPDRSPLFANALRLLKPGGLFISKTPCISEMNLLIRLAVPVARAVGKAPHVSFFTALQLEREIEAAGFTIIERARHGSGRKDPRIFLVARKKS